MDHDFNTESNELCLLGLNSSSFLLDQLVHYRFSHLDQAVIKCRIGGALLGVRVRLARSVVLFWFPEGDDGMALDSRWRNMCAGKSPRLSNFLPPRLNNVRQFLPAGNVSHF